MGRFGHGAGVGEQASGARGGNADRVREPLGLEAEQMPARDRGAERPRCTGRMEARRARLVLARRLADPALHLDAFDERGERLAAR